MNTLRWDGCRLEKSINAEPSVEWRLWRQDASPALRKARTTQVSCSAKCWPTAPRYFGKEGPKEQTEDLSGTCSPSFRCLKQSWFAFIQPCVLLFLFSFGTVSHSLAPKGFQLLARADGSGFLGILAGFTAVLFAFIKIK